MSFYNDTDRRQCTAVDEHGLDCAAPTGHEPPHANVNGEWNPAAQSLREVMSDISELVYAAGWMGDCEWHLWQALTDWRASKPAVWVFADITAEMPLLDSLQREAGGWVWWLDYRDERGGAQFVPEERWLRLLAERARAGGHVSNEQLDIRIRP